jgi:hypothetical protein
LSSPNARAPLAPATLPGAGASAAATSAVAGVDRGVARTPALRGQVVIAATWAAATAARTSAVVVIGGRICWASSLANGNGKALDDATLTLTLTRVHAVVHREVAADHVSTRGSCIAGQGLGLVGHVGAVFPVVHSHSAHVPSLTSLVDFVKRVWPVAAAAKAYEERDVLAHRMIDTASRCLFGQKQYVYGAPPRTMIQPHSHLGTSFDLNGGSPLLAQSINKPMECHHDAFHF